MHLKTISMIVVGACAGILGAAETSIDALIEGLRAAESAKRVEASRALAEAGVPAVPALLKVMDGDNPTARKMAYGALFRMAQRAAGTDRQGAVASALVAELRGEHAVQTRRAIYRLLSFVGDDDSLVEMYRGLNDAQVQDIALFAISRIPGQAATMALTAALQIAEPPFLLGLMQAIGERGDTRAVPAMAGAIRDPDPAIRQAGFEVLAALPDPSSFVAIRQALADDIPGALDGLVVLGLNAGERGRPELAQRVWAEVAKRADLNDIQQCRLLHLLPYLDRKEWSGDALLRVLKATAPRGPRQTGCLLDALVELPGPDGTRAIADALEQIAGAEADMLPEGADRAGLIAGLLEVLGRRGDPAGLPAMRGLMRETEPQIRRAAEEAVRVLEGIKKAESIEEPASRPSEP